MINNKVKSARGFSQLTSKQNTSVLFTRYLWNNIMSDFLSLADKLEVEIDVIPFRKQQQRNGLM